VTLQSLGGKALVKKRGKEHMRQLGAEGGHATVAKYGTEYMRMIGSTGGIKRAIQLGTRTPEGDKQEVIEYLVNRRYITDSEAVELAELDLEDIEVVYSSHVQEHWNDEDDSQDPNPGEDEDDNPQCVCGVYLSEHTLCGCPEGFQTPAQWEKERESIRQRAWDSHLDDYGDYGYEYDEY
jgi:hypothetical protein